MNTTTPVAIRTQPTLRRVLVGGVVAPILATDCARAS